MNIYIVRFATPVKIGHEYKKEGEVTHHAFVVAPSIESAIGTIKKRFPETVIKGVDLQNYHHGLEVIFAE